MAIAALERRRHHAGRQRSTVRARDVLRPHRSSAAQGGRPRHRRPAPRDRAVVQRVLLQRRRACSSIDTIHEYAAKLGLVGQDRHRSAGRRREPRAVDRVEAGVSQSQPWYPGETISVAIGQGAVSVTPIALATMIATVANGGTLVTPHLVRADRRGRTGWQPVPAPQPRSPFSITPECSAGGARRPVAGRQRRPARRGGADRRASDVSGKTGTAQVDLARTAQASPPARWTCATTAGSCSSRRATTRRSPASSSPSTASTASSAAPIAKHVIETFFAKQDGRPLPVLPPQSAGRRHAGRGRLRTPAPADAAPAQPVAEPPRPQPRNRGAAR